MSTAKKLTYSSLFLALGLVLPQLFHLLGGAGPVFLPMHLPVLLAGFYLGGPRGAAIGLLTPLLSSLVTGMPPVPILYFMTAEVAVYGFAAGYFYQTRNLHLPAALLLAMVAGRMALALAVFTLQPLLGLMLSPTAYLSGAFLTGIPGMALQLLFVPLLVKLMEKAGGHVARGNA